MIKPKTISFDIKTGMKNIIGRDLITDDFIAIFELVKNSYDAHAKHVIINFEESGIIIEDNGKGMSQDDLRNKWFAVAYSAKQDGSEDDDIRKDSHLNNLKSKRFYAGAKGVGRFSCDRLGNYLIMTTSKYSESLAHQITVSWKEFEKDSKESFQDIKIPYDDIDASTVEFPNKSKSGTILQISKLNSQWDEDKIRRLKHSLEKLINPFTSDDEFNIEIKCSKYIESDKGKSERQKINGSVKNSILDVLKIKTTQIELVVNLNKITTKLYDRGTLIYHIEENNNYAPIIDESKINLYFLNRSAKVQFGKIMDIEPVNYGNVFLFKNGFRVQPYGNIDDDSWGLDKRKQQGYNRFLGTRDLFGRIDITTENFEQFKEVSSRDGGLVKTQGTNLLKELFIEKAMKRLERYVVGVLWGEAFSRKGYFKSNNDTKEFRERLEDDKDADDYNLAASNLGSKLDFVNLVKNLSDDDNVRIIGYDKNLISFVNEQLDIVQPKFIKDLEIIAEKTRDVPLLKQIKLTEENFKRIEKEKEDAIRREEQERERRIEAEKKVLEEEKKRIAAEKKYKEEEDRRRYAELETEKKEKERYKAQVEKLEAEKIAAENEARRRDEEAARIIAEKKLKLEKEKNSYLSSTRKTLSQDAEDLIHSIKVSVMGIDASMDKLILSIENGMLDKIVLLAETGHIKFITEKTLKISKLITKSRFKADEDEQKVNVIQFVKEYIDTYSYAYSDKVKITVEGGGEFITRLSILDLSVIIDNLISNSIKARANVILINLVVEKHNLIMYFSDNGDGLDENLKGIENSIFDLGVKTTNEGSGIGLSTVMKKMKEMNGDINYEGSGVYLSGATFKLEFKK